MSTLYRLKIIKVKEHVLHIKDKVLYSVGLNDFRSVNFLIYLNKNESLKCMNVQNFPSTAPNCILTVCYVFVIVRERFVYKKIIQLFLVGRKKKGKWLETEAGIVTKTSFSDI